MKTKSKIIIGDCLIKLKELPEESIDCCITSPPYWGLRDYGTATWEGGDKNCDHKGKPFSTKASLDANFGNKQREKLDNEFFKEICGKCGAKRIDSQLGLEKTPQEYVDDMVKVFREVRRVLKNEGTLWLNLGDSYAGGGGINGVPEDWQSISMSNNDPKRNAKAIGLKPKDLVGIPWRVAFALQDDGWYLRQDIIWCLSGGSYVYAKTQKGVTPVMIQDLARLRPDTVQLWNGKEWIKVLGMSKSKRQGNELELVLRSGERISCTSNHKFPTKRGLLEASDLKTGDILEATQLPDTDDPRDCALDEDAAWFAGLYIAEGSHSDDCIQIAGHAKEKVRWERLQKIAKKYGGSITRTVLGNCMDIRMHGKILNAILSELVSGRVAKDKCFSPVVWNYSNKFIASMIDGYLAGDGHWESKNNRWRLGFTRNYNLERDLRTACSRLGYKLILNTSTVKYRGEQRPIFRGEIRKEVSKHFNNSQPSEIVAIRKARCREVYDIGLENEPHLFALASGILTHNSKPNPMPESVTDRCTKAHEYIFLLAKSQRYFFDHYAIREQGSDDQIPRLLRGISEEHKNVNGAPGQTPHSMNKPRKNFKKDMGGGGTSFIDHSGYHKADGTLISDGMRNKRDVWTVTTKPFKEAHFACVDSKTEILTLDGWKNYKEINYKSRPKIATYNLNTKIIEYQPIIYLKEYDYDGDLIKVGNRDLDILMTTNHRNVVVKRNMKEVVTLAENLAYMDKIKVLAPIEYDVEYSIGKKWAELTGWVISEGHYRDKNHIEIYQNAGLNEKRIDYLVKDLPHTKHIRQRKYNGIVKNQVHWYIKKCAFVDWIYQCVPKKELNRLLVSLPKKELQALFSSLIAGDGNIRKSDGRIQFIQKRKGCVDWFEILAMRLGYHTTTTKRKYENCYTVFLTKKKAISIRDSKGKSIERVKYTGKIWCPKTPNGTWVARRNGRIFITGNTFPYDLILPCVLAGSPRFVCKKCGKAREKIIVADNPCKEFMEKDERVMAAAPGSFTSRQSIKSLHRNDGGVYSSAKVTGLTDCGCGAEFEPGVILDPFSGAGTTGVVAKDNNRSYIGVELNPEYVKMAEKRIDDVVSNSLIDFVKTKEEDGE
jgi:DNA modification methylase